MLTTSLSSVLVSILKYLIKVFCIWMCNDIQKIIRMGSIWSMSFELVLVAVWLASFIQTWQPSPVATGAYYVFICHLRFGWLKRLCHRGHRTEFSSLKCDTMLQDAILKSIQVMYSSNRQRRKSDKERYHWCCLLKIALLLRNLYFVK